MKTNSEVFPTVPRSNTFQNVNSLAKIILCSIWIVLANLPLYAQIWSDSFTNDAVGAFPSPDGWQLIWNGAGNGSQVVGNPPGRTGKALQLVGSSCWDAAAFKQLSLSNKVTFEADLLVLGTLSGGCNVYDVQFGLYNPSLGTWGTSYGIITFQSDGNIHMDYNTPASSVLMPFSENTWYHIALDYDLTNRTMGVRINGSSTLAQEAINTSGSPTGLWLDAGHGVNPTLWVANVRISQDSAPAFTQQPANLVINPGQGFSFDPQVSAYPTPSYQWQFSSNGVSFQNIIGATGLNFVLNSSSPTNIGYYRVVAANTLGTNTSSNARITFLNINMYAGLCIYGPLNANYAIQSTPTLGGGTNWTTLTNISLPTQPYIYIDYATPTNSKQFYRAVPL